MMNIETMFGRLRSRFPQTCSPFPLPFSSHREEAAYLLEALRSSSPFRECLLLGPFRLRLAESWSAPERERHARARRRRIARRQT